MMDKQIFTTIIWSNKTVTFVRIKPLNCTFTHTVLFIYMVKNIMLYFAITITNTDFESIVHITPQQ